MRSSRHRERSSASRSDRSPQSRTSITLPQYRALVVLASRGEQNVGDLADALAIHPSTATRLCDRLAGKGLIERNTSIESRREVTVTIGQGGRVLLRSVTQRRVPRDQQDRRATGSRDTPRRDRRADRVRGRGRRDPRRGLEARLDVVSGRSRSLEPGSASAAPSCADSQPAREKCSFSPRSSVPQPGLGVALFDTVVTKSVDWVDRLPLWAAAILPLAGSERRRRHRCDGSDRRLPPPPPTNTSTHSTIADHELTVRPLVARMIAGNRNTRQRRPDGARGTVALPRIQPRRHAAAPPAASADAATSTTAPRRRCRRRRRRDLQGARNRCGVRTRGPVSRRPRTPHAPSRARRVRERLPDLRRDPRQRQHSSP